MAEKKKKWYAVILGIMLVIQLALIVLTLAYAYFGTYAANKPSNIWSVIWDTVPIGLMLIFWAFVTLNAGIAGIITHKWCVKAQLILSIILAVLHVPSWFSIILAIGAHY